MGRGGGGRGKGQWAMNNMGAQNAGGHVDDRHVHPMSTPPRRHHHRSQPQPAPSTIHLDLHPRSHVSATTLSTPTMSIPPHVDHASHVDDRHVHPMSTPLCCHHHRSRPQPAPSTIHLDHHPRSHVRATTPSTPTTSIPPHVDHTSHAKCRGPRRRSPHPPHVDAATSSPPPWGGEAASLPPFLIYIYIRINISRNLK